MMIRVSTISILTTLLLLTLGYAIYLQELGLVRGGGCGVVEEPKAFCGNYRPSRSIHSRKETENSTVAEGKALFKANCSSCHARDMKTHLTGPALSGVEERWEKYPREDLYDFIRNSTKMIQEKHPKAVELWEASGEIVMNDFPNLTDDQIESIFLYINEVY